MKYLYTATRLSHICQFHLPYLQMLKEEGNIVHVAGMDNLSEKNGLKLQYTDRHFEIPFERNPYDPKNIFAYLKLKKVINQEHYDVIVCNTPVGGILTRFAARVSRKEGTRVIYIAHGFHFYKGAPKKNWLLYYPLEKGMARLCDAVVTINEEDYRFAMGHFPGKIERIHGVGVREDRYQPASKTEQIMMRQKEGLSENDFIVICTGELNENKNQKILISAAALLRNQIPSLRVLLAGNGPNEQELRDQIAAEQLEDIVKLLGYRTDLEKVIPAVDVVVSCSRREGMPLNIIEAMLCKKPVVASLNRGHEELIQEAITGYLITSEKPEEYAERLLRLFGSKDLRMSMGNAGFEAAQPYTVSYVKREIKKVLKIQ